MRCPVLIGRQDLVAAVDGCLAAAMAGRGAAVGLVGEPGIGKTRLLAEAAAMAAGRGMVVLMGRATMESSATPFRAISEALLVGTRDLPAPETPELGPFLPILARLLPAWRTPGWTEPREPPIVTAEATLRLLRHLAGGRGLMLALDDLHWADPATLEVLDFLTVHCRELPLALIVAVRDTETVGMRVAGALERAPAAVYRLDRLTAGDVELMITSCTGDPGGRRDAVVLAADGLPLLIEDLLDDGTTVPRRFADSVRDRMSRLSAEVRGCVLAAAVIGEQVDWAIACRAATQTGRGDTDTASAAVDLGLLVRGPGGLRFRHALTRRVILDDLPGDLRAELSGAAAQALLAGAAPDLSRDLLAASLLTDAGQVPAALAALQRSAARSGEAGEITAATAALEAGWALARQHRPDAAARVGHTLARVLLEAGRPAETADIARQVLALTDGRDTARTGEVLVLLARARIGTGSWVQAADDLRAARESGHLAPGVIAEIAVLDAECALGSDRPGQRAAVEHLAVSGVSLARAAGRADLEAEALELVGRVARMRDLGAAADSLRQALDTAAAHGLTFRRLEILNELGTVEMLRDALPDRLERARTEALRCGAFGLSASAGLNLASAYAMTGRVQDSLTLLGEVEGTAHRLGLTPIEAACQLMEGIARAFSADPAAEAHLARAEQLAPDDADLRVGAWAIGRGIGALVLEERARARRALATASAGAPERHARILDAALGPSLLLAALAGETGEHLVRVALDGADPGSRWHRLWVGAAFAVTAAHAGQDGTAALTSALAAGDRYPLLGGLVRRLVAEAAIRTGFTDPIPLLRDAEAAFESLGVPRPAGACRGMLRALGAPAPRRRRGDQAVAPDLARSGVTAREAEVLGLLADRLTNRQIAQQLFLSPKTVEKHVAALAAKLDAADRLELAERARSRGPPLTGSLEFHHGSAARCRSPEWGTLPHASHRGRCHRCRTGSMVLTKDRKVVTAMAIAAVWDFTSGTVEQYEKVFELGGSAIHDQPQRLSHVCFGTPTGIRVIDVWRDEESFAAFGAVLGPAVVQAGLDAPPQIHAVHGFMGPDGVRNP